MNTILKMSAIAVLATVVTGCERIETGHVGLRVGFDKQINQTELQPGSFNQTFIGTVLEFQTKEVAIIVNDMTPLAKDNSSMKDFDAVVIYNINPSSVTEMYTTKNKAFHKVDADGNTYLMYNYIENAVRNAVYIAARQYDALEMSDGRQLIEQEVKQTLVKTIADEKLTDSITIGQVLIRSITPADSVVQSANELVRSKNLYKQKEIEVQTARQEAERISVLNSNKGAVEYMSAMAMMNISEGIKDGKVNTIVVPFDFKGIVNTK